MLYDVVDKMYINWVAAETEGDILFSEFDRFNWELVESEEYEPDDPNFFAIPLKPTFAQIKTRATIVLALIRTNLKTQICYEKDTFIIDPGYRSSTCGL